MNLLQSFKEITNTLNNLENPVNIYDYAHEKNITINQSRYILNSYISKINDINNYFIIFRAEILEFDNLFSRQKIILKFLPSTSQELENITNLNPNQILDFGVFSIMLKKPEFVLNNYSVFSHEMRSVKNLNFEEYPKINDNFSKNKLTGIENNFNNAISFDKKNASEKTSKNVSTTITTNKKIPNQVNNKINNISSTINFSKNKNTIEKNSVKIESVPKNIPTPTNTNINKTSNTIKDESIKNMFNNVKKTTNNFPEIDLSNNPLYDIDEGDEIKNDQKNIEKNNMMDIDTENIIDIITNEKKNELQEKTPKNSIINLEAKKRKPKDFKDNEALDPNVKTNKLKPKINLSIASKIKDQEILLEKDETSILKNKEIVNENISNNQNIPDKTKETGEKKKVLKKRKVKKTHTYVDEEGYHVTSDYYEEEAYLTDEKSESSSISNNFKNNLNLNKDQKKKVINQPKKNAQGQKSLDNFFKK